jgi:hypothetical protein
MEEKKEEKKYKEITILKREEKKKRTVIKNEIKKKIKKYKTLENNIFYQNEIIKYKKEKRKELFTNLDKILNNIISLVKNKPEFFKTNIGTNLYTNLFNNLLKEYNQRKNCVVNQIEYITFIKDLFKQYSDGAKFRRKEMERKITLSYFSSNDNLDWYTLFSSYYFHVIMICTECIKELIQINKKISNKSYDIIENNKSLEKCNIFKKNLYYDLSKNIIEFDLKENSTIPCNVIDIIKTFII